MRNPILTLSIIILFGGFTFSQSQETNAKTSAAYLDGLTETVLINGSPVLRIRSRDALWIEVRNEKRNGEESLLFLVTRLKSFGAGVQRAEEGKLYVSKKQVSYVADFEKENSFEISRSDIQELELKKMGQGFDCVVVKMPTDKKRFVLAGTVFVNGNLYANRKTLKPALNFLFQSLEDFDTALADFKQLISDKKEKN